MTLAALNLRVSRILAEDRARKSTSFAAGTRGEGTGLGCSPLSAQPRAALHDRPNNGTDLTRFSDFAPFHGGTNGRS